MHSWLGAELRYEADSENPERGMVLSGTLRVSALPPTSTTFRPGNSVLSQCPQEGVGELNLCAYCVAQSDTQFPTQDTKPKPTGLRCVLFGPLELRDSQAAELGILLRTGSLRPEMVLH